MSYFLVFGITNSGSMDTFVPSPSQEAHAPNGELNENALGWSSSNEISHLGQEKYSL